MSAIGTTSPAAAPPLLTQREMMIIYLMSAGHTASEIAKLLELRPRTVENHKRSIYEKLGVGSQSHAVARAIWLGLLQPGPPPTLPRRGPGPPQHVGEPGRALLAVLLGPSGKVRDETAQLLISERVPLLVVVKREELIPDHWVWWQRGPIVVILVDPEPEDWPVTIALGAPTVLIRDRDVPDQVAVADAFARQVSGVVARDDIAAGLAPTLHAVAQGLMVMSWGYAGALLKWAPASSPTMPELTAREYDILASIARGHTIRQTARTLGIAVKTVENTQARLFRKLGVRNRTEALTTADALGLIDRTIAPIGHVPSSLDNAGSSPGHREPALRSAWASHEHDRIEERRRQAHPGIDVRVPGRAGFEVTRADVGDGGDAIWADPQAAHDDSERGKRIRATQGDGHRRMTGEH